MLDRVTRLPGAPCLLARGTLPGGLSFWHVNSLPRITQLAEVRGSHYIPRQPLMLTASGDYAELVECKIIAPDTEKRLLVERVIKKFKLAAKTFLLSAILFVVLSGRSTNYLAQMSCM